MRIDRLVALVSTLVLIASAAPAAGQGLHRLYEEALALRSQAPALFGPSPGLLVVSREPGSRAEGLGILVGDLWVSYQGGPIPSLQSFLDSRSAPQSEGALGFLRHGQTKVLNLPAGPVGAGLVEVIPHGLDEADALAFFDLLEAGYGGDRDRLRARIREDRERFERIAGHFAQSSAGGGPGSEQFRRWQESIATFLDLDNRLAALEGTKESLEGKRAALERQLAGVREARQLEEIKTLLARIPEEVQSLDLDRAIADGARAVELAQSLPIPPDPPSRVPKQANAYIQEASASLQLATAQSAKGHQAEAIAATKNGLRCAQSVKELLSIPDRSPYAQVLSQMHALSKRIEALALEQLTVLYGLTGDVPAARRAAKDRLAIAVSEGDLTARMDALVAVADTYTEGGDYLEGISYLEEALGLTQGLDDPIRIDRVEMNLANLYLSLGDYERALQHGAKALEATARFPHRSGAQIPTGSVPLAWYAERETMAMVLMGEAALMLRGDRQEALRRFHEAEALGERFFPGTPRQSSILTALAVAHALDGDAQGAKEAASRALALDRQGRGVQFERFDRGSEALTLSTLAEISIDNRDFAGAEDYLRQAEAVAPAGSADLAEVTGVAEARARAHCITGRYVEAEGLLRTNIERIEGARRSLSKAELSQVSLADLYASNYDLLQYALLQQGRFDELLELAEERRGRALSEHLSESPAAPQEAPRLDLAGMKRIAAEQRATLLVYSFVYDPKAPLLPSRFGGHQPGAELELLIWAIAPDGAIRLRRNGLEAMRHAADGSATGLVRGLRGAVPLHQTGASLAVSPGATQERLKRLYGLLIAPIEDLLPPEGEPLIFVPQGILALVPFAALKDGSGRYLIERHTLSSVPALKLLDLPRQVDRDLPAGKGAALVVGNPQIAPSIANSLGLVTLPNAELEAKTIAGLLGVQPLLGDSATKEAVLARMSGAPVLHFATHGLLSVGLPGGAPGALVLAPGKGDDGLLGADEILGQRLDADLAVLSACDTGRGRLTGDGVLGLAYALMRSGVSSVVVSLWSVPDESTAALMTHFYRGRSGGAPLGQALRRAMLATMADGYREPWQWAGFTLVGRPANL